MTEVPLDTLPGSLQDVVGHELDGGTLQQHTSGGSRFHGQGKGKDDREPELERFVRAVDEALAGDPRLREQPLLIAAVEEVASMYRHVSEHRHLLDEQVTLSPGRTSDEDVRLAACDAFDRWRRRDDASFIERLREEEHGVWSNDSRDIVLAAEEGRIDTLLVSPDLELWGRFDPDAWTVETHEAWSTGDRELVDGAMRAVWRQSGHIRVIDTGAAEPLQARLRY